jgi:hypothetical protein
MHSEMNQSAREVVDLEHVDVVDRAANEDDVAPRAVRFDATVPLFVGKDFALDDTQVEIARPGDVLA